MFSLRRSFDLWSRHFCREDSFDSGGQRAGAGFPVGRGANPFAGTMPTKVVRGILSLSLHDGKCHIHFIYSHFGPSV
jgi:hypothetical protein